MMLTPRRRARNTPSGTHVHNSHPHEGLDHDRPLFGLDGTVKCSERQREQGKKKREEIKRNGHEVKMKIPTGRGGERKQLGQICLRKAAETEACISEAVVGKVVISHI